MEVLAFHFNLVWALAFSKLSGASYQDIRVTSYGPHQGINYYVSMSINSS